MPELQATVSLLLLVKLTYLKTKRLLQGHFAIFYPFVPMLMSCAQLSTRNPLNSECWLSKPPSNNGSVHHSPLKEKLMKGNHRKSQRPLSLHSCFTLTDTSPVLLSGPKNLFKISGKPFKRIFSSELSEPVLEVHTCGGAKPRSRSSGSKIFWRWSSKTIRSYPLKQNIHASVMSYN